MASQWRPRAIYQDVYDGKWKSVPVPTPLDIMVRSALLNALAYTDGRQHAAAKLLGITPRVMAYMMQGHGIPTVNPPSNVKRGRHKRQSEHDLFVPRKPKSTSIPKGTVQ